jgi:branched-chain amino acid transport system substrate-binding protein
MLFSCDNSMSSKRISNLKKSNNLEIGVACSGEHVSRELLNGINIGLDEVNQNLPQGKILSISFKDDDFSINKGIINASEFVQNPNIIGVIGHSESYISVATSSVYNFNELFMISPYSTAKELTSNNYEYIFRSIPNDEVISKEMVNYFIKNNLKKIHICYTSNAYGLSFANSFERHAEEKGLNIVDRVSYDVGNESEFNRIVKRWENYEYDSILFIGALPEGGVFYKILEERNIKVPVISGEAMVDNDIFSLSKDLINSKVFPSLIHYENKNSKYRSFADKYMKKYGTIPSDIACIGYDTIHLIAEAIRKGRSFIPKDIAKNLKTIRNFKGAVNDYSFDKNGELIIKKGIGMQRIDNNRFNYLGRY